MNKYRIFISGIEIVSEEDKEMVIDKFGADFYNEIIYHECELEESGATETKYIQEGHQIKIAKENRTWMIAEEIEN